MAPRGIVIQIMGDGASAARALELVDQHLRDTAVAGKTSASEISDAMDLVRTSLESAGVVEGMRAAIDTMKEMVTASVELGMELGHASKETGISAQNLSVLKYASDVTGVSFEALSKGMGRMSKTMLDAEEGKKAAINSFARLGISQDEVRNKSNDMLGMLGLIADKFNTIPDGPQKAAVAIGLFGKAGMALIPFLDEGAEGIARLSGEAEALGLVLDESGIAKLEQMHEATVQLKGGIEGIELGLTTGLTPALVTITGAMTSLDEKTSVWNELGGAAGQVAIYAAAGIEGIAVMAIKAGAAIDDMGQKALRAALHVASAFATNAQDKKDIADLIKKSQDASAQDQAMSTQADAYDTKFMNSLVNPKPPPPPKPKHSGGITLGDQSGGGKGTDGIDKAETSLAQAQAEAVAKVIKDADDAALAANDAWHKMMLISDAEYYSEKLRLEEQSIDAQENALRSRVSELQDLQAKQHADPKLKRNSSGQSSEELKTATQIVQLNQQINDLEAKRTELETQKSAGDQERALAAKLSTLKVAAELEEETNTTITARLALMREENSLAIQKATAAGNSAEVQELQALEKVKEAKLQIADVDRQIRESEESNTTAVDGLKDAVDKGLLSKKAAAEQINRLNAEEAAQLKDLVAQYDALAQLLGGQFLQNANNLHATMDKLNRPDKKPDEQLGKTLGEGVESMASQIATSAANGKESFHKMVQSIEQDAIKLAIKLATQKWLTPLLEGVGGGGGLSTVPTAGMDMLDGMDNGHATGGYMDSPGLVGEEGPELFFPQGPGTIVPNDDLELAFPQTSGPSMPAGALSELARSSGGGQAPNVTMNLINNSSQPVTARPGGTSFDADMKTFIIHTILEDQASGGPISQANGG